MPHQPRAAHETGPNRAPGMLWRVLAVLAGVYLTGFGALVMWAGEADDSPGLGGLGLITALIGVVMLVRQSWPRRTSPEA